MRVEPVTKTNDIVNFDPRRCFPDPRVNWGDWDRMQFIVFTDHMSTSALLGSGLYPKVAKYPGLRRKEQADTPGTRMVGSAKRAVAYQLTLTTLKAKRMAIISPCKTAE